MIANWLNATRASSSNAAELIRSQLLMPAQTGKDVTLEYVSATSRYVWTPIADRYWARWTVNKLATSNMWVVDASTVYDVVKAWSDRDASITYNPAWSQGNSSGALNGTWSYTNVTNRYLEFSVTPGADGKIYVVYSQETNGGIIWVTIDGGTDLVNELPLNGGHRELDTYIAVVENKNTRACIASGLSIAAHTVRLTISGTKNAGSSNYYLWFEGYGITPYTIDDAQIALINDRKIVRQFGANSANSNEYAYHYKPSGAAVYEWTGTTHLNEVYSVVTWRDEIGNDISVSVGDTRNHGNSVVLNQTGVSRHSQTGTTNHANAQTIQTFTTEGLNVYHRHDWLTACSFDQTYPAMWNVISGSAVTGRCAGGSEVTLNHNDDARYGNTKSRLCALWSASAEFVAWVYFANSAPVSGWSHSVDFLAIRDHTTGTTEKIYLQRTGGADDTANEVAAVNDVWESTVQYRISNINPASVNWI